MAEEQWRQGSSEGHQISLTNTILQSNANDIFSIEGGRAVKKTPEKSGNNEINIHDIDEFVSTSSSALFVLIIVYLFF